MMPGNHVATPDGRHVWEYAPKGATDLAALVKSAAAQVLPDAILTSFEQRALPGEGSRLVTTLTRHPGGAAVQVHARIDESFTLVYDAIVTRVGPRVRTADGGGRGRGRGTTRPPARTGRRSSSRGAARTTPAILERQPDPGRQSRCGLRQVVAGLG